MKNAILFLLISSFFYSEAQFNSIKITNKRFSEKLDISGGLDSALSKVEIKPDTVSEKTEYYKGLSKEGNKKEYLENAGEKYFQFYDGILNYIDDDPSTLDHYYLKIAMFFKKQEEERLAKRNEELEKIIKEQLVDGINSEAVEDYEKAVKRIADKYDKETEYFHKKAVEYWFYFRSSRKIQNGVFFMKDAEYRTQLFFENNLDNDEDKFLNSFGLTFGSDRNVSVLSELFKDYIGPFRVSINTLVTAQQKVEDDSTGVNITNQTEKQSASIQRIIGGGGNLIGLATFPLVYYKAGNGNLKAFLSYNSRLSFDVPVLGTIDNDVNSNWYNFLDLGAIISGKERQISLLGSVSAGYFQANDRYWDYLELPENDRIRNGGWKDIGGMVLGQVQGGIDFGGVFRVLFTKYYGNYYVDREFPGASVALIYLPKK